jgi:hypothetical protein
MDLAQELVQATQSRDVLEACQRVVAKHLGSRHVGEQAVCLDQFARTQAVTVKLDSRLATEGMIERDVCGATTITLRQGASRRRQRFTMAHELGHWMLQQELADAAGLGRGKLFRGLSTTSLEVAQEERLANLLAAEMLMPASVVPSLGLLRSDGLMSVLANLCRECGTSRVMAIRRIADVRNVNIAWLELVPRRFNDLDSDVQVDDAVFVSSGVGTLYARERTYLVSRVTFRDLVSNTAINLSLHSPKGEMSQQFSIDVVKQPVPHAYAAAIFEGGW